MGLCGAGAELVQPPEDDVREGCNMGYALRCARLPKQRPADAVRFAVLKDAGAVLTLCYVCEAGHRPTGCGTLEYGVAERCWITAGADARVRKMAECYLETYLAERRRGGN
jgi:hypothetical protein